jgi:uncharacterized protein YkwD
MAYVTSWVRRIPGRSIAGAFLLIALAIASCGAYEVMPEKRTAARERDLSEAGAASLRTREIESLVYEMVNKERKNHGLKLLQWDGALADLARHHSSDMAARGTLSHTNRKGEDPTARAKRMGLSVTKQQGSVTWTGIAENIGMLPMGNLKGYGPVRSERDVAAAMMKYWLESPSHRSNLLNPRHDVIGIGAAGDGRGTYYLTQDFK